MTKRKTYAEQKRALKIKLWELEEEYKTALYYETMPAYDPLYQYSYDRSNFTIPGDMQSVDAWARAVIKHMNKRAPQHGGGFSNAYLVSIPNFSKASDIDLWLEYVTKQLKKRARVSKKKET